ncbi:PIG-L deacetylase family protein [Thiohalorhabdus sp. Cl-TMA]|uniref:PIG-L deacetylase family protein n=1 Tax=Thiohalorhabdus methylotrophus TaxID=3242694 RepID=A0ABV4TYZ8_9GAMM
MSILVVAAHPDDEVLGCGGTIARWALEGHTVRIGILAEGATSRDPERRQGDRKGELSALGKAAQEAGNILGAASVELLGLPDNRMDSLDRLEIVKSVEAWVERYQPSVVLTHYGGDVNIDHRRVHEAVITACRPQPDHPVSRFQFFEVPSSTEWQPRGSGPAFEPDVFVDITETLEKKIEALRAYESEMRLWPHSRSLEGVRHLAHWRGATVGKGAAESFMLGRELL